jgi:hypothetical protein
LACATYQQICAKQSSSGNRALGPGTALEWAVERALMRLARSDMIVVRLAECADLAAQQAEHVQKNHSAPHHRRCDLLPSTRSSRQECQKWWDAYCDDLATFKVKYSNGAACGIIRQ